MLVAGTPVGLISKKQERRGRKDERTVRAVSKGVQDGMWKVGDKVLNLLMMLMVVCLVAS